MKWSCTIGLASKSSMPPSFLKDCSSLCLQKSARIRWVQPKLMALRILYHPIIPMIEAQPVPKLRLSRIDKLGRSLVQFPTFLDRCIRKYDAPKKKHRECIVVWGNCALANLPPVSCFAVLEKRFHDFWKSPVIRGSCGTIYSSLCVVQTFLFCKLLETQEERSSDFLW
jgi:hypothetical protein